MVSGRWFVTPHAVFRYRERIAPSLTYEQALAVLIRQSQCARRVKPLAGGLVLYRGPRPHRIRFLVSESTDQRHPLPQLVTLYAGRDRGWGS